MILVFIVAGILFLLSGIAFWFTFGPGGENIKDPIAEHAKMHELGIAHGHKDKSVQKAWEEFQL